jgi:hypothetical protein
MTDTGLYKISLDYPKRVSVQNLPTNWETLPPTVVQEIEETIAFLSRVLKVREAYLAKEKERNTTNA